VADTVQGTQQGAGEPSLTDLIERSAELKGQLVAFGQSTRFDRWLTPLLLEAAGPERQLNEGEAIRIIDHSSCGTACQTVRPWWTGSSPDERT
jgi:hypothetical protein